MPVYRVIGGTDGSLLAHYGPDAQSARATLYQSLEIVLIRLWPDEAFNSTKPASTWTAPVSMFETIQSLDPQTDLQRSLQAQALAIASRLAQAR